eukprot:8543982-Karenia_brevis.AAC.1
MANVPYIAPARSRGCRMGQVLRRRSEGGKACISKADHDFAITEKLLISTTGVAIMATSADTHVFVDDATGKPHISVAKPQQLQCFARCLRYNPPTVFSNMLDWWDALDALGDEAEVDFLLLGMDNGNDFTIDHPIIQHLAYRRWIQLGMSLSSL